MEKDSLFTMYLLLHSRLKSYFILESCVTLYISIFTSLMWHRVLSHLKMLIMLICMQN